MFRTSRMTNTERFLFFSVELRWVELSWVGHSELAFRQAFVDEMPPHNGRRLWLVRNRNCHCTDRGYEVAATFVTSRWPSQLKTQRYCRGWDSRLYGEEMGRGRALCWYVRFNHKPVRSVVSDRYVTNSTTPWHRRSVDDHIAYNISTAERLMSSRSAEHCDTDAECADFCAFDDSVARTWVQTRTKVVCVRSTC